ncbi:MAG TPA: PspC domain-containing protein, partial [Actinotalea sp.]|nr:PspC domain-containing protein [Actinotalea sp.]
MDETTPQPDAAAPNDPVGPGATSASDVNRTGDLRATGTPGGPGTAGGPGAGWAGAPGGPSTPGGPSPSGGPGTAGGPGAGSWSATPGSTGGAGAPPPRPEPHGSDGFFDSIRRSGLARSDDRWIGGVGGGVALRFGIDPLVVRGVLAVSLLFGGLGLVLYGLGWLLLPDQRDGRIHLQQLLRGDVDVAVVGGFAMILSGLAFPSRWASGMWWGLDGDWWRSALWLSLLALAVVVGVAAASRRRP